MQFDKQHRHTQENQKFGSSRVPHSFAIVCFKFAFLWNKHWSDGASDTITTHTLCKCHQSITSPRGPGTDWNKFEDSYWYSCPIYIIYNHVWHTVGCSCREHCTYEHCFLGLLHLMPSILDRCVQSVVKSDVNLDSSLMTISWHISIPWHILHLDVCLEHDMHRWTDPRVEALVAAACMPK